MSLNLLANIDEFILSGNKDKTHFAYKIYRRVCEIAGHTSYRSVFFDDDDHPSYELRKEIVVNNDDMPLDKVDNGNYYRAGFHAYVNFSDMVHTPEYLAMCREANMAVVKVEYKFEDLLHTGYTFSHQPYFGEKKLPTVVLQKMKLIKEIIL